MHTYIEAHALRAAVSREGIESSPFHPRSAIHSHRRVSSISTTTPIIKMSRFFMLALLCGAAFAGAARAEQSNCTCPYPVLHIDDDGSVDDAPLVFAVLGGASARGHVAACVADAQPPYLTVQLLHAPEHGKDAACTLLLEPEA